MIKKQMNQKMFCIILAPFWQNLVDPQFFNQVFAHSAHLWRPITWNLYSPINFCVAAHCISGTQFSLQSNKWSQLIRNIATVDQHHDHQRSFSRSCLAAFCSRDICKVLHRSCQPSCRREILGLRSNYGHLDDRGMDVFWTKNVITFNFWPWICD